MPLLFDLGPLALMGIAILALLLLYGLVMLCRWLASLFTGLGAPLSILAGWIRSAESWLLGRTEAYLRESWKLVGTLFRAFFEVWSTLFGHTTTVHQATHAAMTRVVTQHIPQAQANAENFAAQTALSLYNQATDFTQAVETSLAQALGEVYDTLSSSERADFVILADNIRAEALALSGDIANVVTWTADLVRSAEVQAANEVNEATAWAERAITTVAVDAADELRALTDYTTTELRAVSAYAATAAAAAEQGAINDANASAAAGAAALWPTVQPQAQDVIDSLSTEYPETAGDLRSIPAVAPLTIAGVTAATLDMTAALSTYVNVCGIPLCDNLSGLGRELQTLLGLFADGALLAFLAWAIGTPTSAAEATAIPLVELIDAAGDVIQGLVGAL